MSSITLQNVTFCYPGNAEPTLDGLNLEVHDGEAHALLGASGAGKTTLLNLLSGLLSPTAGQILFGQEDVSQVPGRDRGVAQVFQFPVLYESMTAADNIGFPLRTRGNSASATSQRVTEIAAQLDLTPSLDKKPAALSLFEKQRVAVAKALVRPDVKLVLLDEPLTAVEPQIKWRLRQTLRKVQDDLGVTMIYVTHDQTEALTFADRVSLLTVDGIVQTGTPAEVYQAPAQEFVGHFVGSPGMNFIPATTIPDAKGERLGFRAEWASLDGDGQLPGKIARIRLFGTRDGEPYGLLTVDTEHGPINIRGAVRHDVDDAVQIHVHRHVAFAAGQRLSDGDKS